MPIYDLSFQYLNSISLRAEICNFHEIQINNVSLMSFALASHLKSHQQTLSQLVFIPLSSMSFIYLIFTFDLWFILRHFFFVWGRRPVLQIIFFFYLDVQLFQHRWLKRLSFSTKLPLFFCQRSVDSTCVGLHLFCSIKLFSHYILASLLELCAGS